jgi:hypothetical protein
MMYETIAKLTDQICSYLQSAASELPGAWVSIGRPGMSIFDLIRPRINVYLIEVNENPSLRNQFIPSGNQQGILVGLDLKYLVTFYGRKRAPLILIQSSTKALASSSTFNPTGESNPASVVHLSLLRTGTEEMAQVWDMMGVRHAPSLMCQATGLLV